MDDDDREIVNEFARIFYTERDPRTAFARFVAPGYIQHNPGLPDGRDAAVEGSSRSSRRTAHGSRSSGSWSTATSPSCT